MSRSKVAGKRMTPQRDGRAVWSATKNRAGTNPNPSPAARAAYEDEARLAAFRELVHRLRTDAGLTQLELAERMGTTQSAIARMEGGGTQPTLQTLEKLASAVGAELLVGVGENLSANGSIAKLVRDGHAVIR